jgi:hypothetical protein
MPDPSLSLLLSPRSTSQEGGRFVCPWYPGADFVLKYKCVDRRRGASRRVGVFRSVSELSGEIRSVIHHHDKLDKNLHCRPHREKKKKTKN